MPTVGLRFQLGGSAHRLSKATSQREQLGLLRNRHLDESLDRRLNGVCRPETYRSTCPALQNRDLQKPAPNSKQSGVTCAPLRWPQWSSTSPLRGSGDPRCCAASRFHQGVTPDFRKQLGVLECASGLFRSGRIRPSGCYRSGSRPRQPNISRTKRPGDADCCSRTRTERGGELILSIDLVKRNTLPRCSPGTTHRVARVCCDVTDGWPD